MLNEKNKNLNHNLKIYNASTDGKSVMVILMILIFGSQKYQILILNM